MVSTDMLKITGAIDIQQIITLQLKARVNEHATLNLKGYIDAESGEKCLNNSLKGKTISVQCADENGNMKPFFTGFILRASISSEAMLYQAEISCVSASFMFDIVKKSRSFQNKEMTYRSLLKEIAAETGNIVFTAKDGPIEKPILQYIESDWEFAKRMASRFGTVVIPDMQYDIPQISVGLIKGNRYAVDNPSKYTSGIRTAAYNFKKDKNPCELSDFIYYQVEDERSFQLGDKVTMLSREMAVMEKHSQLVQGELQNTYILGLEQGYGLPYFTNEKISGMSLLSTVLETRAEVMTIKLDIDANRDSGIYWFRYTPQTGNQFYCMPQVGTRVSLYFSNDEEGQSTVLSCVRTGGCSLPNPSTRQLLTEHGKRMTLAPASLDFEGGGNLLSLLDAKTIMMKSSLPIQMKGKQVSITAKKQVVIGAQQEFYAHKSKSTTGIQVYGSRMMLHSPKRYMSGVAKSYPPVAQIVQEEPKKPSLGGIIGAVLGAVAVVVVVAVFAPAAALVLAKVALGVLALAAMAAMSGCAARTPPGGGSSESGGAVDGSTPPEGESKDENKLPAPSEDAPGSSDAESSSSENQGPSSEREVAETAYKKITVGDFDSLTEAEMLGRLIFHEDGSRKSYEAMAWCLHNRLANPGPGDQDSFEGIVKFCLKDMTSATDKYWNPEQYAIDNNLRFWYGEYDKDNTIKAGWDYAMQLGRDLAACGNDTEKFKKLVDCPYPDQEYKYWVNSAYADDPDQIQIGNQYYSNKPH